LCGIERALADHDDVHLELACARLELLYAVTYAYGGIPLLYMGDELGLCNDTTYLGDAAKADDNRWLHRPRMDWALAERRHQPGTLQARLFAMFAALGAARAGIGALDASGRVVVQVSPDPHLLCFTRSHPVHGSFVMLANFGRGTAVVRLADVGAGGAAVQRSVGAVVTVDGVAQLSANGYLWLTAS